jgi:hypothetical protein
MRRVECIPLNPLGKASPPTSSKMGKCCQIVHFLDISRISFENPQDKQLIACEMNNSVLPVSRVSIVSFHCAYDRSVNLERTFLFPMRARRSKAAYKAGQAITRRARETEPRTEGVH